MSFNFYDPTLNQAKRSEAMQAAGEYGKQTVDLEIPDWSKYLDYNPNEPLTSIFGEIKNQPRPVYDDKRQKIRKNQAVLSGLGSALTNIGDSMTLGMGGHVVQRDKPKTEEYIDDYLGYRDRYNDRIDRFNYQKMNQLLSTSFKLSDSIDNTRRFYSDVDAKDWNSKYQKSALEQRAVQNAQNNDLTGQGLELRDKQFTQSLAEDKRQAIEREKDRDEDRRLNKRELDERYPKEKKVYWKDDKGHIQEDTMPIEQYDALYTEAMRDPNYQSNMYEYVVNPDDPYGPKIRKLKDGVSKDDIIRDYLGTKGKGVPYRNAEDYPHARINRNKQAFQSWKQQRKAQGLPALDQNRLSENEERMLERLAPSADGSTLKYMQDFLIEKGYDQDEARMFISQILFNYYNSKRQ